MNHKCKTCGSNFSPLRAKLGYNTCLECGDKEAQMEINRKNRCSAPLYNKGTYGYILNKQDALDAGR